MKDREDNIVNKGRSIMILNRKSVYLMLIDAVLINLAAFGSFYLRFEGNIPQEYFMTSYHTAWAGTLIYLAVFTLFGLYNRLWQYASINELLSILYAGNPLWI